MDDNDLKVQGYEPRNEETIVKVFNKIVEQGTYENIIRLTVFLSFFINCCKYQYKGTTMIIYVKAFDTLHLCMTYCFYQSDINR